MYGVSALSPDDVWAVGYQETNPATFEVQPLIEHWDGTAWSLVPAAPVSGNGNILQTVWAQSSDDVWTVGGFGFNGGTFEPLIEHWDGTAWSVVPAAPPPPGTNNLLLGVSGTSSSDVWAVGRSSRGLAPYRPLTEHWDGTRWSLVRAPNAGLDSSLSAVWAASSETWAVGGYFASDSHTYPLIEQSLGCT